MSRDIILTSYDPINAKKGVLYPCHTFCHFNAFPFYDRKDKYYLNAHLFLRSSDVGLGLPFNVASYALLTHIIASMCDMEVGQLVITTSNTHIYANHIKPLKSILDRKPLKFPSLKIKTKRNNFDTWTFEDFELNDYQCHNTVKMDMVC
jgi:thymidylate synthase